MDFEIKGKVEEIVDVILFLCSNKAAYVTGSKIAIDGAYIRTVRVKQLTKYWCIWTRDK